MEIDVIFHQNFIQKYEGWTSIELKGEIKNYDGKLLGDEKIKKFFKGLKQQICIFMETRNIFNPFI